MAEASGFSYLERKNGEIAISRDGGVVTVLRGQTAIRFLQSLEDGDAQERMARVTGNYKRGNEKHRGDH